VSALDKVLQAAHLRAARGEVVIALGDKPGHPFRGNQWGRGANADGGSSGSGLTTANHPQYSQGVVAKTPKLSSTQRSALLRIAKDHEGQGYPGSSEFSIATARGLLRMGLIEVANAGHSYTEVKGRNFGRSYTTVDTHSGITVRLTDAGRKAIEASA
jgi:hypothetical protein